MNWISVKSIDDRLNPVLVKEIRQQLRSNYFVLTFLAFQFSLLVGALLSLLDKRLEGIFWWALGLWLYLVIPFRALFIVRGEYYDNTLEPILMTALKAERIIMGKWWSLILQNGIVISSLLPYVIVRYLLGGVELIDDLLEVFLCFIGALPLISFMLIFSVNRCFCHGFPLFVVSLLVWYGAECLFSFLFFPLFIHHSSVIRIPLWVLALIHGMSIFVSVRFALDAAPNQTKSLFRQTQSL